MKGYIQVYTGDGKGKTTAAFGLALRAVGAGKKVFIAQFIKGKPYSEIDAVHKYIPAIKVKQYGLDCFIYNQPTPADIQAARKGLAEVAEIIAAGKYDMIVLDEVCIALYYNIFPISDVVKILTSKPEKTEIIVTGRYAPNEIISIADLVSEIREIKHYYSKGVEARKGIEY